MSNDFDYEKAYHYQCERFDGYHKNIIKAVYEIGFALDEIVSAKTKLDPITYGECESSLMKALHSLSKLWVDK